MKISHTHSFFETSVTRKLKNIVLIGNTRIHIFVYFDRFTDLLINYLIEVS